MCVRDVSKLHDDEVLSRFNPAHILLATGMGHPTEGDGELHQTSERQLWNCGQSHPGVSHLPDFWKEKCSPLLPGSAKQPRFTNDQGQFWGCVCMVSGLKNYQNSLWQFCWILRFTRLGKMLDEMYVLVWQYVFQCYKSLNGFGPAYFSELLRDYTLSHALRFSSDTCVLKIQRYSCKTHGFCICSCFGPHIWNSLPQDLRHCSTLSSFKAKLKIFLFSQYFRPN